MVAWLAELTHLFENRRAKHRAGRSGEQEMGWAEPPFHFSEFSFQFSEVKVKLGEGF